MSRSIPPRSWRRAGYAFIVFAAVATIVAAALSYDVFAQRDWRSAGGVVLAVTPSGVKDVMVLYRFRAGGLNYVDDAERRPKSEGFAPGGSVIVRYDPTDPRHSTLRPRETDWTRAGFMLLGAAFVWGLAVGCLWMGRD